MTKDKSKEFKIEFVEGCFDNIDMSQDELNEFVAALKNSIQSGEFFKNSCPVTEELLDELTEEERELIKALTRQTIKRS